MEVIKQQVDAMETTDRGSLRNQLNVELAVLRQSTKPEDAALLIRLNALDDLVEDAEKSFGTKAQEGIGAGINTVIDTGAAGLKMGTEFVGNQVKKGADAVVQIGAQVADIVADPNRSQKEKMIHVAGLAAIVAVPAVLLYKLFSKMSGSGLPEGQKPGFGRKLLKWTGFAFIGSLGVRALAPMVVEQQKKLTAESPGTSPETNTPQSNQPKPREQPATPVASDAMPTDVLPPESSSTTDVISETIRLEGEFQRSKLQVVQRGGEQLMEIDGKRFRITKPGEENNLVDSITEIRTQESPPQLIFNGLATINAADFQSVQASILFDPPDTSFQIPARAGDGAEVFTLEFTPEKTSSIL